MGEKQRGRPKKTEAEKRSYVILIRLNKKEKDELDRISQFFGNSYSDLFRLGIAEMKRKMEIDIYEIMN